MGKRTNSAVWTGTRWKINVQKDGVRKSFYSGTAGRTGQREANAKADAWLDDGISPRSARVSELYVRWLDGVKETTCERNYKNTESRWRIWVLPIIGSKRISNLTEQDLQEVINKAYAAGRSKKTLQVLAVDMRAFCRYCRRCKETTFNPEELKIPAGARLKGKQVLQPADILKLFNNDATEWRGKSQPDDLINAYRFQVLTGLRPGELIGLRWEDIRDDTVRICRAVNVDGEETQGKNQNAVRSFVLSDMARRVLDAQKAAAGSSDTVFGISSEKYYYGRWKAYCTVNGITAVSPYELRHTFVSVVKTLPAGEVKSLVGHSENMDTFGVYGHALAGDGEAAAGAVNEAFQKIIQK